MEKHRTNINEKRIHVYIFENYREDEKELREGIMFNKLFNALAVPNTLFVIRDKKDLASKWKQASKNFSNADINFIHWSGHGDSEGVLLSSGEKVSWNVLSLFLLSTEDREKLILCLSSCEGAGASSIGDKWPIKMYRHLIAPIRDIFWYEAAVAYTNFYYAIRIPKLSIGDAVEWMNQSLFDFTGNPTFNHYDGQLQNLIKHAPNPLIKAMHIAHKDELSKFTSIYNN